MISLLPISRLNFCLSVTEFQLSVQKFCGDLICLLTNARRFDLDLYSLLTVN